MEWKKIHGSDDILNLVKFESKVHPRSDLVTVAEYEFWLKRGLQIFVLQDENTWIGVYQILENDDEVFFHGFAVDPDFQGEGYGQILMDKLIQSFGHKKITCKTRPDNTIMKALLKKNGFKNKLDELLDGEYWTWWTKRPRSRNS